jgi:hypothetical protein
MLLGIITNLIQDLPWEIECYSSGKEIQCFYRTKMFIIRFTNMSLDLILSQLKPISTFTSYFLLPSILSCNIFFLFLSSSIYLCVSLFHSFSLCLFVCFPLPDLLLQQSIIAHIL